MSLTAVVTFGCGGQMVDLDAVAGGGGKTSSTGTASNGGTTSTNPGTGTAYCYGEPPQSVSSSGMWEIPIKAIGTDNPNCIITVGLPNSKMLAPSKLNLYFPGQDGKRSRIPFVGTLDQCATATTYGGWYATNTTGGPSDIGLCPCSCNVAHQTAMVALTPMEL